MCIRDSGTLVLPISKVTFGFASGGADFPSKTTKDLFGGGGGAGVSIQPVAFLVVKDGSVRMLQLADTSNSVDLSLIHISFCAVLGHVYPVYFGFKGGKAVSVATGTIIAIKPVLILPLLAVFFIVFLCSKMVSLASICCCLLYTSIHACGACMFHIDD